MTWCLLVRKTRESLHNLPHRPPCSLLPSGVQPGRQALLAPYSPQLENKERVAIELLAQEEVDRRDVLARIRPVGARAVGLKVSALVREERKSCVPEDVFDIIGHLACQQLCREDRPPGKRRGQLLPVRSAKRTDFDLDPVRPGTGALHPGCYGSLFDIYRQHLAPASIGPATRPSLAPRSKPSRTSIQRLAHQLRPNPPRPDCALMPPFASRGREGSKYSW